MLHASYMQQGAREIARSRRWPSRALPCGRTRPEAIPFDDTHIFDSDSIAKLSFLPKSVVISGAGIIAIEFAKIFAKLHCSVTMLVRGEAEARRRWSLRHRTAASLRKLPRLPRALPHCPERCPNAQSAAPPPTGELA